MSEKPKKKKNKCKLKTVLKPIVMACGCGPKYTSSHTHIDKSLPNPMSSPTNLVPVREPGPPVSPMLLRSPCPKIDESVAMAKQSINPFEDYKISMNQMIKEREIETEDDLKELLRCFLDINPPLHHNLIVRAFVDVCSQLRPPHDRRGKSLGRLLRLYVNPIPIHDDSHQNSLHTRR